MSKYMYEALHFLAELGVEDARKDVVSYIMSAGRNAVTSEQTNIALRYLHTLAEEDDQDALLALGSLYYTGAGTSIPQDFMKAQYYYEKAAEVSELKNHWALNNLGYCYYYGRAGETDYKKAYSCFAASAMYGNPNAMYKLGDMYYFGNFVEKDIDASFYWYSLAKSQKLEADADYVDFLAASIAMRIGRAFLFGEGVGIDYICALFELQLAETLFYRQLLIGDENSREQLPKVQEMIKIARDKLDESID